MDWHLKMGIYSLKRLLIKKKGAPDLSKGPTMGWPDSGLSTIVSSVTLRSFNFQVTTDCVDFLLDLTNMAEYSGAPIYDSFSGGRYSQPASVR